MRAAQSAKDARVKQNRGVQRDVLAGPAGLARDPPTNSAVGRELSGWARTQWLGENSAIERELRGAAVQCPVSDLARLVGHRVVDGVGA
ncbi:MAG: hypothetical protein QOE58_1523 [Actinomycetota bacterium]|nr:hypothetical protein [Actinomycetota bacterium]